MMGQENWEKLNRDIEHLTQEYAELTNRESRYESGRQKEMRLVKIKTDRRVKSDEFDTPVKDFKTQEEQLLKLEKEVRKLRVRDRIDKLEQKIMDRPLDQSIEEKDCLELQTLYLLLDNRDDLH